MSRGTSSTLFIGALLALCGLAAAPAVAQEPTPTSTTPTTATPPAPTPTPAAPAGQREAKIFLRVEAGKDHRVTVGRRIKAHGKIRPFVDGQKVMVTLTRHGKVLQRKEVPVLPAAGSDKGRFKFTSRQLVEPGPYHVVAVHVATPEQGHGEKATGAVGIQYPDLDPGQKSRYVRIFTRLLSKDGYYVPHTSRYGSAVGLAVLAFRKVNRMARTEQATPGIFEQVAKGKGTFKLRYPNAGRHVEVDISRQVMALADHGKAKYIFHVSTGAPATPTITGHYRFYRRQPGYNSEGMYYSVYWHNGYAVHGFDPVPAYNASHGCVREPIPDAIFIYNWVRLGMSIYTYH
jgi:hypothetical protein